MPLNPKITKTLPDAVPSQSSALAITGPVAASTTGPKLTEEQQRLLLIQIAKYHWYDVVIKEVQELDPSFPSLTSGLIAYYRAKIRAGEYDSWLVPLLAHSAYSPLTSRESRIRTLVREYRKLEPRDSFEQVGMSVVNVAAERRAILAQIAKEMGHDRPNTPIAQTNVNILNTAGGVVVTPAEGDEARLMAGEALLALFEAQHGMATALADSHRPPALEGEVIDADYTTADTTEESEA